MVLYLFVFFSCLVLDTLKDEKYDFLKRLFLIYLFIFFCFGYTVGSDWRHYEKLYTVMPDEYLLNTEVDKGFYYLLFIIRKIIPDFWLFLGLIKCLYLYALIRVIRIFTNEIFLILGLLMSYQLLFMLVDNPLRFMTASIAILYATPYLIKKEYKWYILISSISILFHFSLIFPILISILVIYQDRILKSNKRIIIIYLLSITISFFPSLMTVVREYLAVIFPSFSNKLVEYYLIESTDGTFSIGSLLNILIFVLFLANKDRIIELRYGKLVFFMSFIYFILSRALINLPTGFRISIYFSLFTAIGLYYIFKVGRLRFKLLLIVILGVLMTKKLYNSYQYIPYTNSIFYVILDDHESFRNREQLNKIEYKKRTGKSIDPKYLR